MVVFSAIMIKKKASNSAIVLCILYSFKFIIQIVMKVSCTNEGLPQRGKMHVQ